MGSVITITLVLTATSRLYLESGEALSNFKTAPFLLIHDLFPASRWSASQSPGLHLCSRCYHSNAGDPHTSYTRHTGEGEPGTVVGERARERTVDTMGTYPGAVVTR